MDRTHQLSAHEPSAPSISRDRGWLLRLGVLVSIAAVLYVAGLEHAPIHVHYDEIYFGVQSYSIAQTGRDTNGRMFPLYFQIGGNVWYQPIAVYFSALVLKVLPLSDAAIRLPTAIVGLVNIVLVYFSAWRLFRRENVALLSAALLALTPAHFIHSRVAFDYLYPLPFVLTWLVCLLTYLEQPRSWQLFVATSSLGIGFYSYLASVVMMPVYLAITVLFLLWERRPWSAHAVALAGFAWPLLLIPPFLLAHPTILADFLRRYEFRDGLPGLDPLQRLREVLNNRTVAVRSNLYYDFFSPGFLFVSGGSNVVNSTREAGVFLSSFLVFLLAGAYDAVTRPAREKTLVALGFLTAPLAACLIVENYAIDRALALLPFGVLLATFGILRLWSAPCTLQLLRLAAPVGVLLAGVGVLYMGYTLVGRGSVSNSPPWIITAGAAVFAIGWWAQKTRRWRPVVVVLLLLGLFQFQYFYRDYFGDYRARSAAWYGNNVQGAIERVIALDGERPAPKVLLSEEIQQVVQYWRFYLQVNGRIDLLPKAEPFRFATTDIAAVAPGTLLVCLAIDKDAADLASRGELQVAGTAGDPNDRDSPLGPGEHVTFIVYRRVAPATD